MNLFDQVDWSRLLPVLDEAPVVVFARDRDGRYLYVNRAFEQLVGQSAANVIGRTVGEVMPAEAAEAIIASDREALERGSGVVADAQGLFGEDRRAYITVKVPLDGMVFGVGAEVTERRRTEEALQAAALGASSAGGDRIFEELARYLAAILGVDLALIGRLTDREPKSIATLGIYGGHAYRQNLEYPLDVTPCRDVVGRGFAIVAQGVSARFPGDPYLAPMGAEGYAGYPLNDAAGRPIGVIAVLSRRPLANPSLIEAVLKIFAVRAGAEIERRTAEEALRASEAGYRAIFESSEDAVFVHDWDSGAILDVNPKACSLYGYTPAEFRRLSPGDLGSGEEPYTSEGAGRWIAEAKAGAAVRFEWHRRNKDGSLHWDEVCIKAIELAGRRRLLAITREITARKLADEALRTSEAQYRAIFNASLDALVLRDENFRIVDVNAAFVALTGQPREFFIGRDDIISRPSDPAAYRRALERLQSGEQIQVETVGMRADGTRLDIELRGVPMRYQGRPHLLFVARDISERKRSEEALRASEAQYRAIFNASADALVLWNSQLQRVDVNAAYERMFGYTRDEVLNGSHGNAMPEAHAERRRALVRRTLAGEPCNVELESLRRNGERFQVEVRTIPIQHRGEPHVLAIARDITERKRAEAALRESEEQYRGVFNAAADALVLRDAGFRIVEVNQAYLAMSGRTREEVIGVDRIIANPPQVMERIRGLHQAALAGEPGALETQMLRADGTQLEIEVRAVPMQYRGAQHVLYMGRDITERRRAEAARGELEAQLRQAQKMEAIGQLAGGIAHDFNNVLMGIMGYLALAADNRSARADPKLARHLGQAQLAAQRARDLIAQLLTFSRGRKGAPRPVALAALVEESLRLLGSSLPSTLELETAFEPGLPRVMLDPVQLEQVVLNLCINARDAMGGNGRLRVGVRVAADHAQCSSCRQSVDGRHVELWVADDGPGIPPDVRERMFEPFFSTKEVGRGSGMGLAMVHGIVHEHGGHIVLESAPGRGTTFRVRFAPIAEKAQVPGEANEADASDNVRHTLAGHVLVVDDEPMVGEVMAELLAGWGLSVTVKSNPVEAEAWLSESAAEPDVVITDQTMPRMTGLEFASRLAASRPQLPVILCSGYDRKLGRAAVRRSGVRAFLGKPIEADALFSAVRDALGAARSAAKAPAPRRQRTKSAAVTARRTSQPSPRRAQPRR
jgi:PAS domain S-box-containing protein